jgi:hypothetical protein
MDVVDCANTNGQTAIRTIQLRIGIKFGTRLFRFIIAPVMTTSLGMAYSAGHATPNAGNTKTIRNKERTLRKSKKGNPETKVPPGGRAFQRIQQDRLQRGQPLLPEPDATPQGTKKRKTKSEK